MEQFWEYGNEIRIQFRNRKSMIRLITGLMLIGFVSWIIYDTLVGDGLKQADHQVIADNVQLLKEMENQAPPDIRADGVGSDRSGQKKKNQTQTDQVQTNEERKDESRTDKNTDQTDEQERIMKLENPDISVFNQWFDGCAIVGDSLAESAGYYGFLNSSILFAKIGCSVVGAGDLLESMVQMHPGKVFLALGSNDMENYGSDVEKFTEHYRNMVSGIRESLPDSQIFAVAVLPVQQKAASREPAMKNVDLYNENLEKLCEELKLTFLDPGFILEKDDSLYEPDGIHAVKNFYYKWLTYLADMAGVSK